MEQTFRQLMSKHHSDVKHYMKHRAAIQLIEGVLNEWGKPEYTWDGQRCGYITLAMEQPLLTIRLGKADTIKKDAMLFLDQCNLLNHPTWELYKTSKSGPEVILYFRNKHNHKQMFRIDLDPTSSDKCKRVVLRTRMIQQEDAEYRCED